MSNQDVLSPHQSDDGPAKEAPVNLDAWAAGVAWALEGGFREPAADRDALDAARYRWLREHFRFANDSMSELWFDASIETAVYGQPEPDELDRAIDAAMAPEADRTPQDGATARTDGRA